MKYPGGKSKELPLIEKYMPKNVERYFEPFVGGGAIFFGLNIRECFINDYSKDLITLYKMLQEGNKNLLSYLSIFNLLWKATGSEKLTKKELPPFLSYSDYEAHLKTSSKKKENTLIKFANKGLNVSSEDKEKIKITANKTSVYMLIRDVYNYSKDIELHIAAYFFMREYCYSSMFRFSKNGLFNVPYGGMSYNDKDLDAKISYMFSETLRNKLATAKIDNFDFESFLKNYSFSKTDFIFLDPPYDSDFSTYDQKSFDKNEQIRLKNTIDLIKEGKWMLVIKKTDFIVDLYKNYYVYEYDKNYMVSFKNRNDREVKHLLITNYEIKEEKQDELVVENKT